jgi:regulator of replication initiation timing
MMRAGAPAVTEEAMREVQDKLRETERQVKSLYQTNAQLMQCNATLALRNVYLEKRIAEGRFEKDDLTDHKTIKELLKTRKKEALKWANYTEQIKDWSIYRKDYRVQADEAKQQLAALQEEYKTEAKDWAAKRAMLEKQQRLEFERAQRDK